ncbi:MAG: hypothetical protein FOGNACKC_06278 [Anaerolineae bacterium]|nr:hypothetical protein [Anaerolineae bacterium]
MNTLEINSIITDDPAFIVRDERLDETTIAAYAEEPERLPAVEVWADPASGYIFLLDGQHRLAAHQRRGLAEIPVTFFEGSRAEAEARARVANLLHGLQLTGAERRRARLEVIERLYEYSNNWIAEDFLRCSSSTVAALRAGLEEAGRIPRLTRLKRKDGGTTPRTYDTNADADDKAPDDGLFGSERDIKPPVDLLEPEPAPDNNDGGYNVAEDGDGEDDEGGGLPSDRHAKVDSGAGFSPSESTPRQRVSQTTLKLAQLGEALALEVTLYVDGAAQSVPVTLLIADGPVAGAPETTPEHRNVLVIEAGTARSLGLLFG